MRRRDFIKVVAGSAMTWPLAARAQQPATPVIGFLSSRSLSADAHLVAAFHKGLKETGYIEGQNITTEYRWAEGRYDHLPELAAELVRRQVSVIIAGATNTALAVRAASARIPIIFVIGADPVKVGLIASLNRPGGNITGVNWLSNALPAKRFELLHEVVPNAHTVGLLVNPANPNAESDMRDVRAAADALGVRLLIERATSGRDLDTAFAMLIQQRADALFVDSDPFLNNRADQLVALAAHYRLPGSYPSREYAEVGGLMSYGASLADAFYWAGIYTGRILEGDKPGDLPVVQSTKIDFVINIKAAKALGLEIPAKLLALANEPLMAAIQA